MSQLLDIAAAALDAAKNAGATSADALAIHSADLSASIRHGNPESIESAEASGVGLRVFVGQASASLSSSDLSAASLRQMAEQAVAIARVAPADHFAGLAPETRLAKHFPRDLELADDVTPSMEKLQALARECEETGRGTHGITNSEGADASASRSHIALATSHGFASEYSGTHYSLSLALIAGANETMQRDYDYSVARHLRDLSTPQQIGAHAADRTLTRMHPRKLPSQRAVVYFEPRVGRSLLGAFASAISGSAIARGTSFLKEAMDTQVFGEHITITDDALIPRALGSHPFDGEGVACVKRDFIAHGMLTSWLLDTRSANQLGLQTTGHAVRGLNGPPHPAASNLYLHAGKQTPEALFRELGDGFYITETIGSGVNLITGDYSVGASGFWLEGGVRAFPVSEVTIAGNLRDMFKTLIPANDLKFEFATNVPTLAIPNMTIAGN